VGVSRSRLIGSIGVAALVAGSLVVSPIAAHGADRVTVQVLGINDFHGRILKNSTNAEAGAAVLTGAIKQLEGTYPNTVFAAAGDLIGASTFESFISEDKPTIDALNAADLDVSAVGNHEFDQGYDDLVNRVMAPFDPVTNPLGGAAWQYLGANVRKPDNSPALPESWVQDFGSVRVGFVGAVTDHLPELVSPAGIEGLTIEPPVVAANRTANELKAQGADIVILLVHEGAATPDLASSTDPTSDFGKIVNGVNGNVDAIISGHTHLTYNHLITVPEWVAQGRDVTTRPVVSAGQYGLNLDQLLYTVDPDSGQVLGVQSTTLPLAASTAPYTPNYPADPATTAIVSEAVAEAAVLGAEELGEISGPFNRAKLANGTTENRGGESTLGNFVAEVQQWATAEPTFGEAQIAFMNPGGLRADMVGTPDSENQEAFDVTYRQAADVQPFANTLVNMKLTGDQIKLALEQQWQPAGSQRPMLRLGISEGFTYTYDPNAPQGSRITQMWLDGDPIRATDSYSVTVNSFLAAGGDSFGAFAQGVQRRDTGQIDLEAMVDYLAAAKTPVAVNYTQRSVGVSFPSGAPTRYQEGDTVAFSLSSLAFSAAADVKDTSVAVKIGDVPVGEYPVDNTIGTDVFDEYGKASVRFALPAGLPVGAAEATVTGNVTGTQIRVPLVIYDPTAVTDIDLSASANGQVYGSNNRVTLKAVATTESGEAASGTIEFKTGAQVLGSAPLVDGIATLTVPADTPAGVYSVNAVSGEVLSNPVEVTVEKATSAAALLATKTSYRANPFLPALLIGAVGLNNGQRATGTVQIKQNDVVVATVPVSSSFFLWVVPRNLTKGTYKYVATFVPGDPANVSGVDSNGIFIQVR